MSLEEHPERVAEARSEAPTREAVATTRQRRTSARSQARWSGLPLALSLALVAFAVLFGIYGPRVVDRATPPLGIPAWDLGEAAATHYFDGDAALTGRSATAQTVTVAEAEQDLQSRLGAHITVPDLSDQGFKLHRPVPIPLRGSGSAVLLMYSREAAIGLDTLSVVVVPDREQYVVFSPFGRPLFLPSWEVYPIELLTDDGREASAFLWSDGTFVRVVVSRTSSVLSEVQKAILSTTKPPGSHWS